MYYLMFDNFELDGVIINFNIVFWYCKVFDRFKNLIKIVLIEVKFNVE